MKTLAATLECTDIQFLPDDLKQQVVGKGRGELMRRFRDLTMMVE